MKAGEEKRGGLRSHLFGFRLLCLDLFRAFPADGRKLVEVTGLAAVHGQLDLEILVTFRTRFLENPDFIHMIGVNVYRHYITFIGP